MMTIRALACLAIIWFHLRPGSWLTVGGVDLSFITAPSGTVAVYIFYLISGFSIGYGFFSKKYTLTAVSLRSFYINRYLRIAPAYYVSILLCMFIFYPQAVLTPFDVLRFFTFTANIDYFTLPFQQLLVIISTQMQFYLVSPVLFVLLRSALRVTHPVAVGASILILGATVRFVLAQLGVVFDLPSYMLHTYVTVWGMIDYFLFGMFVSFATTTHIKINISKPLYGIVFISWILWIQYGNFFALPWPTYALYHMFIIPPTLCILFGWYILSSHKEIPILSGIGKISYGLYLYHFIFFDLLYRLPHRIDPSMLGFINRFVVVFMLSLIASLASYHFIEKPLRLRRKLQ